MVNYEELYNDVKNILSEKRFKHSEGVVKRAIEYAEVYGVDINTVKLAAIAHDIAKEFSEEENKAYLKEHCIELDDIEKTCKKLLHSKVGASICKEKYGFSEDMVNSIWYHTTGRPNMSMLEKIIYLADATEENRGYEDIDYYVNLIKEDIDKGMIEVIKWEIKDLLDRNKKIHINSVKCYDYYISKM